MNLEKIFESVLSESIPRSWFVTPEIMRMVEDRLECGFDENEIAEEMIACYKNIDMDKALNIIKSVKNCDDFTVDEDVESIPFPFGLNKSRLPFGIGKNNAFGSGLIPK